MTRRSDYAGWTWAKLEALLGIQPRPLPSYSGELLEEIERLLGHELPRSYVDCIQRWGCGVVFGFFVIWTPGANPHLDIRIRSPETRDLIRENIAMKLWDSNLESFLKRLTPFGVSENGDILCWDPLTVLLNGEMPIHLLDSEQASAPFVGNSLLSFFGDYCADGKLDKVFPVGRGKKWNLPFTFESITC